MHRWILVALALACAFAGPVLAAPQRPVTVTWQGRSFPADNPPSDLSPSAREAILAWSEHARALRMQLDLDPTARVLLFSPKGNSRVRERLALIERTGQLFDRLLPLRNPATGPRPAPAPVTEGPLPEDPESPPPNAPKTAPERPRPESTWGAANLKPDSQCAVMLILRDRDDYESTLEFLLQRQAYLKGWVETARTQTGFTLELPLCGAYTENADGMEEWNPDNELVHRAMQLYVLRRYGQQPFWLSVGLAWHAELELLKGIYCFPFREGFVGIGEHADWDKLLAQAFEKRADKPLEMAEFARWKRGSWEDEPAHIAWGVVDYLVRFEAQDLARLLEDFRVFRAENGKRQNRNGTWERIVNYEIPLEDQRELLSRDVDPLLLEKISTYWRTGAGPKPAK